MSNGSTNQNFSDQEREILEYTRTSIFERRKTQYILLIFYLGVVGACTSLVLNNYKPPQPNDNLMLVFLFPITLIIPVHMLFWYHTLQIEQLDTQRLLIIPNMEHWQSKMGVLSVSVILLLPLIALPTLSGFLLCNGEKSLFEIYHFLCVLGAAGVVCLVVIVVELYGYFQTKKIRSSTDG